MTIVEFLNARLDEAEEDIELAGRDPIDWCYTKPEWVRADVMAKRAIIEDYETYAAYYRDSRTPSAEGQRFGLLLAVARIAETYSEHPDYQQEWKP